MVVISFSAAAEAAARCEPSAGPSEGPRPSRRGKDDAWQMGENKRAQECPPPAYRRRGNGSNLKGHVAVAQGPVATRSSYRALTRSAASNSTRQILVTGCRASSAPPDAATGGHRVPGNAGKYLAD